MTRSSNLAKEPKDARAAGGTPTYEVGYGRPPEHTRVKPGQVLNPRGRPKGQRNVGTVLRKALNERTRIREGTRVRSVTKLDAIVLRIIGDAASGNAKAQTSLLALMRAVGLVGMPDEPATQEPLTTDDHAVIADFLERQGGNGTPEAEVKRPDTPTPAADKVEEGVKS